MKNSKGENNDDDDGFWVDCTGVFDWRDEQVAYLAGLAVGVWEAPEAIAALRTSEKIFHPKIDEDRRRQLYRGWMEAVARVKSRI